jgi:hypothetical protein
LILTLILGFLWFLPTLFNSYVIISNTDCLKRNDSRLKGMRKISLINVVNYTHFSSYILLPPSLYTLKSCDLAPKNCTNVYCLYISKFYFPS